ncbi:MAG: cell division protein ZapA [Paludibacter sp.]|nr:cell division protein ZapA [Paludibacter sp.]
MKDDNLKINVQIGGLRLPLRIARNDEEMYRKAEKMVVKYIDKFQKQYSQRPTEEILIMVAYQIAVMVSKQELSEDIIPLADKIQLLDQELEKLLSE